MSGRAADYAAAGVGSGDLPSPAPRHPSPTTDGEDDNDNDGQSATPGEVGRQLEPGSELEADYAADVGPEDLPPRAPTHASPTTEGGEDDHDGRFGTPTEVGRQLEPGRATPSTAQNDPPFSLPRVSRHFATLGLLMFSSIWGTLAREGLVALNTYDGRSITPVIWAQAVGCFIMGWTVANKPALESWYAPAFVMLGTGFCGSLTTFSSWILQVFQAYGNQLHYNRGGLHNVMDALTQTFATLGLSLAGLGAGRVLAGVASFETVTDWIRRKRGRGQGQGHSEKDYFNSSSQSSRLPATPLADMFCFVVLGMGFWIGAALLAGFQTQPQFRPTSLSIVFSPPGAILRWYLSRWNSAPASKRWPYWPLGTFTANILATAIIAGVFVAQHYGPQGTHLAASSITQCHVLYALQEGFCGCLSTVSTFAIELRNLEPRSRAVGYALGSYVIGIAFCVIIIGSPWWTNGMDGSCRGLITYHT